MTPPARFAHRWFQRHAIYLGALGIILIGWLLLSWNLSNILNDREENVRENASRLARALQLQTAQTLSIVDTALALLADQLAPHANDSAEIARILNEEGKHLPEFISVIFINAHGIGVAATASDFKPGADYNDREYFRVQRDKEVSGHHLGEPMIGRTLGRQFFPISRRVEDKQGRFLGVLMGMVEPRHFARILEQFAQGQHGAIAIAHTRARRIIARAPQHERHFGQDISGSALFRGLLRRSSGIYEVPTMTDGITRIIAYDQLEGSPLVMLVGFARQDLRDEYLAETRSHLTGGALFTLGTLAVAYILTRAQRRRQREEEQIRETHRRFELAADSAAIGVWEFDVVRQSVLWDDWMYRHFGYAGTERPPPQEIWRQSVAPGEAARVVEALDTAIARRAAFECVYAIRRRDGSVRHLLAYAKPQPGPDGEISHLTGVGIDITARVEAENAAQASRDQLEQQVQERTGQLALAKEAAEAANIAKSQFLANMSHELRTPLSAITGMSHLVRRAGVLPQQAERLDKLDAATRHLLEVINAILDISKIEAGKVELADTPIDVTRLVNEATDMLQHAVHTKGLVLIAEVPSLPTLRGDPTRLRQALLNYLNNALKFTTNGQIAVRVAIVHDAPDHLQLRFEVEDSGIGISPEAQARLFTAFEQVNNSSTREFGGTGLGLAITRKIARLMQGDAGVESQSGRGSTFWFTARLNKA